MEIGLLMHVEINVLHLGLQITQAIIEAPLIAIDTLKQL